MIDLFFLAFFGLFLAMGLRRPFLWVLVYIYIDVLAPQRVGYGLITSVQVSLIAFAAAFGGWLLLDRKRDTQFSYRQGLMLALLLYCGWTTGFADFPESAAFKWDWVWKALVFAIFLPLTLTSRLRIEAALLVLLLAMSMVIIGPGIKVVFGGGGVFHRARTDDHEACKRFGALVGAGQTFGKRLEQGDQRLDMRRGGFGIGRAGRGIGAGHQIFGIRGGLHHSVDPDHRMFEVDPKLVAKIFG